MLMKKLLGIAWIACIAPAVLSAASVELRRVEDQIQVAIDGKPFTTYYFSPVTAKPYLMPLRTPSGVVISRDFPIGNDISGANPRRSSFEPHQRPLFFGHGDVDGLDFWQEPVFDRYFTDHGRQAYGHMAVKAVDESVQKLDAATVKARFTLLDPSQRPIGEETQTFTFRGDDRTRIIDCEFILHATAGPLVMGDTKEGTFGIRLSPELSAPNDHMLNSLGSRGERAIWGKAADWIDYSGSAGGRPVGIAVFDSPNSFHHPTTWHARAYGLLAANPFGIREFTRDKNQDGSRTVPEGESLRFRYRVVIYDGEFTFEQLSDLYRQYADEEKAGR